MDIDGVQKAEEEFKLYKSRRARKRKHDEPKMETDKVQKTSKRPHFPPLKGEKLMVRPENKLTFYSILKIKNSL